MVRIFLTTIACQVVFSKGYQSFFPDPDPGLSLTFVPGHVCRNIEPNKNSPSTDEAMRSASGVIWGH